MALALLDLDLALRTPTSIGARAPEAARPPLSLGRLDEVLPDGGLPRGAIVEIASPSALARSTSLVLTACAAAQAEARLCSGDPRTVGAWCAFVDPWSTLHAPAVARAGVDLARLLVVRPPLDAVARVAVRIVRSRAFCLVAIDLAGIPGASTREGIRLDRWVNVVRRLALAVENTDTTVLLSTDLRVARPLPLPVSMRIELSLTGSASRVERIGARTHRVALASEARRLETEWRVKIAKERHGRVGNAVAVAG